MTTSEIQLHTVIREDLRTGVNNKLRDNGFIPGVIYTAGKDSVNVAVEKKLFLKEYERGDILARLADLNIEGGKTYNVLVKHVQLHPVTDKPLHIEFISTEGKDTVVVPVGVKFINHEKSQGIKRGGTLNIVRRFVELRCDPANIPNTLTVDLDGSRIGQSIHISSINLPENSTPVIKDRDFTICTIAGKGGKKDVEEDAAEDAEVAAA